jgi:hypothetical protein
MTLARIRNDDKYKSGDADMISDEFLKENSVFPLFFAVFDRQKRDAKIPYTTEFLLQGHNMRYI